MLAAAHAAFTAMQGVVCRAPHRKRMLLQFTKNSTVCVMPSGEYVGDGIGTVRLLSSLRLIIILDYILTLKFSNKMRYFLFCMLKKSNG